MKKIRVYEIAKDLNVSAKEIISELNKLNIDVKSHMSSIEGDVIDKIYNVFSKNNTKKSNVDKNSKNTSQTKKSNRKEKQTNKKDKFTKENQASKKDKVIKDKQDNKNKKFNNKSQDNKGKKTIVKNKKTIDRNKNKKINEDHFKNLQKAKPKHKNKSKAKKKAAETTNLEGIVNVTESGAIEIPETIIVKDFAAAIGVSVSQVISKLIQLGIMASQNQELDFENAELIGMEFDKEIVLKSEDEESMEDIFDLDYEDKEEDMIPRPPVVTVMGHVDHGKTSLLDSIRNTHVTKKEAGGITQHIGAYTVRVNDNKIVFLDTPGHEAFTAMRSRGAQVTDLAILVVAADDGVMPQTIEAINHAKAADVPIIVAINKMDKEGANVDRIKQELSDNGLVPDDWGGDAICVPVSARTGQGIDELLEMVATVAEMEELKANPNRAAVGTVIEAQLDKGRGPTATVLVQKGTLRSGDMVVSGVSSGRIRAMFDDRGKKIKKAGPSIPVLILGLSDVPEAGEFIYVTKDEKTARSYAEKAKNLIKADMVKSSSNIKLDDLFNQISDGTIKDLNIIIKTDVRGTIDAVKQSFEKLSNEEVKVNIIHGAVGGITDSDVNLAAASNAVIIGFNVRPSQSAIDLANYENIDIRTYRVIYDAIEDIKNAIKGMLAPKYVEEVIGRAEVRAIFKVPNVGSVAGIYVLNGKITRNATIRLIRNDIVVHEGEISSLRRFKDDVKELASGYEGGLGLENYNDVKENDILEAYIMKEVKK
ncbi:translation initiation factor IF-2 [Miniphocaeibacter halophilus]|uniref:Translation initiation factor IF-2 n=1 Tax=Miniphocaeibacter halophilus TaxID=2931922 RepID=A0AC61MTX5_9FIRM|nr:translation initiation factor IF-2 [Miniphocaeibacter halophilus]QQK07631.1 translation initiation factor IF-2 [Miniphocaeibacter halophilus]